MNNFECSTQTQWNINNFVVTIKPKQMVDWFRAAKSTVLLFEMLKRYVLTIKLPSEPCVTGFKRVEYNFSIMLNKYVKCKSKVRQIKRVAFNCRIYLAIRNSGGGGRNIPLEFLCIFSYIKYHLIL